MSLPVHVHNAHSSGEKQITLKTNMLAKEKSGFWPDLHLKQAHCSESYLVASEMHNEELLRIIVLIT